LTQSDLFSAGGKAQDISLHGYGELRYLPDWLDTRLADRYFTCLHAEIPWQQPEVTVYGQHHQIPRLQAWYGDSGATMTYSGSEFQALPWHPVLRELKSRLHHEFTETFNSVLVNLYRDGHDCVGWHADDEPELGETPTIASVSLGACREFCLKPKSNNLPNANCDRARLLLSHGDLVMMSGATQRYWHHSVPRTGKVSLPRINLTFRRIRQQVLRE